MQQNYSNFKDHLVVFSYQLAVRAEQICDKSASLARYISDYEEAWGDEQKLGIQVVSVFFPEVLQRITFSVQLYYDCCDFFQISTHITCAGLSVFLFFPLRSAEHSSGITE